MECVSPLWVAWGRGPGGEKKRKKIMKEDVPLSYSQSVPVSFSRELSSFFIGDGFRRRPRVLLLTDQVLSRGSALASGSGVVLEHSSSTDQVLSRGNAPASGSGVVLEHYCSTDKALLQRPSLRLRRRPRALQLDGPSPLTRQRPSLRLRRRPRALSLDGLSPLARQRPSPRSRRRPERVTLDGPSPGARQRQRGQQQSSLSPTVPIEKIGGAAQQRLLPSTSQQGEQRHEASFLPPLSASLPFESPTATLRRHTAHARIALSRGSATTPRTRTQKRPSA